MTSLIVRNGRLNGTGRRNWSAFDDFDSLVDRIFSTYRPFNESEETTRMPVELIEKDNNFILKAMLPGLKREDISIEVSEDSIHISGEYQQEKDEENSVLYKSEFYQGKFARTIALPQSINHQKAKADYKDGILTLNLPKSEKEMNKVIKLSL